MEEILVPSEINSTPSYEQRLKEIHNWFHSCFPDEKLREEFIRSFGQYLDEKPNFSLKRLEQELHIKKLTARKVTERDLFK